MTDLTNFDLSRFTLSEIDKGWSGDKKYHAVDKSDGTSYFLRVSPIQAANNRAALFDWTKQVAALDVPMCRPLEIGVCDDGVCSLYSWIDGVDLRENLADLPLETQYALGVQSGAILRQIHTIPAPIDTEDWAARYNRKIDAKIAAYKDCGMRFDGDNFVLDYLAQNRHLLTGRPQHFQHGDYHDGNMMLESGGGLRIIDFDRYDIGDPWQDFNRIVWSAQTAPRFAAGQIHGYFNGLTPPVEFFRLMALYIAVNTLASLPWAVQFGQDQIDVFLQQNRDVLAWFDDFKSVIPAWYAALS